jgi:hypothetical protein
MHDKRAADNTRLLVGIFLAVAAAGAASAGLSLIGFKGAPVLIGGWVQENTVAHQYTAE